MDVAVASEYTIADFEIEGTQVEQINKRNAYACCGTRKAGRFIGHFYCEIGTCGVAGAVGN